MLLGSPNLLPGGDSQVRHSNLPSALRNRHGQSRRVGEDETVGRIVRPASEASINSPLAATTND